MTSKKITTPPAVLKFFEAVHANRVPAVKAILKREKLNPDVTDQTAYNKVCILMQSLLGDNMMIIKFLFPFDGES